MKANCQKSLFQLAVLQEELNLERKLVSNAIEKERSMTRKRDDGECLKKKKIFNEVDKSVCKMHKCECLIFLFYFKACFWKYCV